MFDNISQMLHTIGGVGYLMVAPVLRAIAVLLVVVALYKNIKANERPHKWRWIICALFVPLWTWIWYIVYYRFIQKSLVKVEHTPAQAKRLRQARVCLIFAVIAYVLSLVISMVSFITFGAGYIKSIVDDEPLVTVYDMYGNEYHDIYDVPIYDREGNAYVWGYGEPSWFSAYYQDQNGNRYEEDYCYIDEDGYFYYDSEDALIFYDATYYTDGEKLYFALWRRVYWEEDGSIRAQSGKVHIELFEDAE